MNYIINYLKRLLIGNTSLLLVDGDNVSPITLKNTIETMSHNNFQIEVFCNCFGAKCWLKEEKFDDVIYHLVKTEPQAADLKMKSKMIQLLVDYSSFKFANIFIATNDHTFKNDIACLSKVFSTSVISSSGSLLSIPNVRAIEIARVEKTLSPETRGLIKCGQNLASVGSLLKSKGVVYEYSLSKFLQINGFVVHNGIVIQVPDIT